MLSVIVGALIPATMITASAMLLQGIWTEHRALGERIRSCSSELRHANIERGRKQSLLDQLVLFRFRVRLTTAASLSASSAVACFVTLMLGVGIALHESARWKWLVLVAFVAGAAFLLVAITLVLGDLWLANRTLDRELADHAVDRGEERIFPQ